MTPQLNDLPKFKDYCLEVHHFFKFKSTVLSGDGEKFEVENAIIYSMSCL